MSKWHKYCRPTCNTIRISPNMIKKDFIGETNALNFFTIKIIDLDFFWKVYHFEMCSTHIKLIWLLSIILHQWVMIDKLAYDEYFYHDSWYTISVCWKRSTLICIFPFVYWTSTIIYVVLYTVSEIYALKRILQRLFTGKIISLLNFLSKYLSKSNDLKQLMKNLVFFKVKQNSKV